MQQKIILASGSKQRKLLMDSLGIPYEVIPADINEKLIRDDDLEVRAEKIAKAKAEKILKEYHKGIIISADTFGACGDKILEKPHSLNDAREMLKFQSEKIVVIYTGFYYIDTTNNFTFSKTAITKLELRKIPDDEIENFIKSSPVTSWAGGFSPAYTYQQGFIKKFIGSLTGSLYGLPAEFLILCLEKSGINL